MPHLIKTIELLDKYAYALRTAAIFEPDSAELLRELLDDDRFKQSPGFYHAIAPVSDSNHSKHDAMKDFVQAIGKTLAPEVLHHITAHFITLLAGKSPETFMLSDSLGKMFLCYELLKYPVLAEAHLVSDTISCVFPHKDTLESFRTKVLNPCVDFINSPAVLATPSSGSSSSSASSSKRSVALLDVDHTLLFSLDTINLDLLQSLLNHQILDIYLFTDMVFSKSGIKDRTQLITRLEAMGFVVHGTITISDVLWSQLDPAECSKFYDALTEGYHGSFIGNRFKIVMSELLGSGAFPNICNALRSGTSIGKPGEAFADASQVHEQVDVKAINTKSYVAKILADIIQDNKKMKSPKGLMFELFHSHLPDWVSDIVVADDRVDVIDTVNNIQSACPVPVLTIHVTDIAMGNEFYNDRLEPSHLFSESSLSLSEAHYPNSSSMFSLPSSTSNTSSSSLSSSPQQTHNQHLTPGYSLLKTNLLNTLQPWSERSRLSGFFDRDIKLSDIVRAKKLGNTITGLASPENLMSVLREHLRQGSKLKLDEKSLDSALLKTIQIYATLPDTIKNLDLRTKSNREQFRDGFINGSTQSYSLS